MEKDKATRILNDIRAIQSELESVRIHCIELEKIVMLFAEENKETNQSG
jgi:hypothetical protein